MFTGGKLCLDFGRSARTRPSRLLMKKKSFYLVLGVYDVGRVLHTVRTPMKCTNYYYNIYS